jgi:ribA/ribD-fused uncharacterized protein
MFAKIKHLYGFTQSSDPLPILGLADPSATQSGGNTMISGSRLPGSSANRLLPPRQAPLLDDKTLYAAAWSCNVRCVTNGGRSTTKSDLEELQQFLIREISRRQVKSALPEEVLENNLKEVDQFIDCLEEKTQRQFGEVRYRVKTALLGVAIDQTGDKPMNVISRYLDLPYFKGKFSMLISIARTRMEHDVQLHYPTDKHLPSPKRLNKTNMAEISQGDYVTHVSQLFNLERKITRDDLKNILEKLSKVGGNYVHQLILDGTPIVGQSYKSVISHILTSFPINSFSTDKALRNFHPASVFLQTCCGMVFHPSHKNPGLTERKSPYAFENICETLAVKHFTAVHENQTLEFFNTAFVREDPCYEAVVKNIINYPSNARAGTSFAGCLVGPTNNKGQYQFHDAGKKNGLFSNFWQYKEIKIDNEKWKSVEHYFQAQKFRDVPGDTQAVKLEKKRIRKSIQDARTPAATKVVQKKAVSLAKFTLDWNNWKTQRTKVMYQAVFEKFSQDSDLKQALLATGTSELMETMPLGRSDTFWGVVPNISDKNAIGANMLGQILQQVRVDLIAGNTDICSDVAFSTCPTKIW